MQKAPRYIEQDDSLQESIDQKIRVRNGGRIEGTEGGLRIDVFDHDENSEYDFSDYECPVCELPEHAQNHIIEDIEYEESNA
jgi:hypothetical protein